MLVVLAGEDEIVLNNKKFAPLADGKRVQMSVTKVPATSSATATPTTRSMRSMRSRRALLTSTLNKKRPLAKPATSPSDQLSGNDEDSMPNQPLRGDRVKRRALSSASQLTRFSGQNGIFSAFARLCNGSIFLKIL